MKTLKDCYDKLAEISHQLHDGLITEPEWLSGMVSTLMERDRFIKQEAATKLNEFLMVSLDNPMSSQELTTRITSWQETFYYLLPPLPPLPPYDKP